MPAVGTAPPPAPPGHCSGGGDNATAPQGDSSDKRCTERTGTPARLGFPEGRKKRQRREVILGGDGAAGSEGVAARGDRDGGEEGERRQQGQRGQEGTEGMEEGGVGGPSAWSRELPARLDSHSLAQPQGFGKPHVFQDTPPKRELQHLVVL